MYLTYTAEQQALRDELRAYFGRLMTPERIESLSQGELDGPAYKEIVRQLGQDGWLGLAWPEEYGGKGRTLLDQYIFFDESQRAHVPVPFLTTNTVGPTIMAYGTEEQKAFFLPKILKGDLHFSIGYSEPGAGTDLASLKTTAVRDGDSYVINGQKMWTSLIQHADYIWLACRTDPDAKRHKGLSIIIVPTDAEGFSYTPVHTIGGGYTSATYYDNVRVPVGNVVLGENEGWRLITSQLNHERVALSSAGMVERKLEDVRRWAQETKLGDGRRVVDQEWVQITFARLHAKVEFLKLLNWKVAWSVTEGNLNPADASAVKIFGSELYIEVYRALMEVIGQASTLTKDSAGAVLSADLERAMRNTLVLTFGGGTNEIQRDIIAMVGLAMPRAPR
ncbi:MAG: 3-oxocholest-4-en-26-oyl-CoA dehydrogenase alpha subunit [Actinomycetota bacterium]|jgi:alkylation response protein AidB-like acyl-CoA dehydrogenase|nr:3-oxocholest-4-en-26-oyl-CoA dehydrogenase alpha subunit [Actinomycetota bacterium]